MKSLFWLIPVALVGGGLWWAVQVKNAPPEVRYTVAKTAPIVDTLITNGKVEPVEYASVRAERAGIVSRLLVEKGQFVQAGALLAELENAEGKAAQESAEARVAQIRAELEGLSKGGRASDLADLDGQIARLSLDRKQAQTELATVQRLIAKKAATPQEATALTDRIALLAQQIEALQQRRAVLFTPADRSVLEARLREAQTSVGLTRQKQTQAALHAPISGIIYQLDPRKGAFLNPGDLLVNIGRVDELTVKVFIDEPELGRVAVNMPAVITWDGLAGRSWEGKVEKMPVQIVPLGTRQVGEVSVRIANADHQLPPGANINAAIKSREAAQAVIIPKESLRRDGGAQGVFVMDGDKVAWRVVKIGVTNVTHAQVLEGIKAGDRVLLATDLTLKAGQVVKAVDEEPGH